MRTIGLLATLAMATAAPAMAMNSGRDHQRLVPAQVYAASTSAVSNAAPAMPAYGRQIWEYPHRVPEQVGSARCLARSTQILPAQFHGALSGRRQTQDVGSVEAAGTPPLSP